MPIGFVALAEGDPEPGDLDLDDPEGGPPKPTRIKKVASLPVWLHLTPAGPDVQGRDGRAFAIEDPAAIIERTVPELPLLVDWDHESMWFGSTKAALWIDEIVFVDETTVSTDRPEAGFWAHVERWTPEGESDVRNFRFRNISPVIRQQFREPEVEGEEPPLPLLLNFDAVALTNRPNLRMVSLNREGAPGAEGVAAMTDEELAELRALLGLAEDADATAILAAVTEALEEPAPAEDAEANKRALLSVKVANRVLTADLAEARAALVEHTAAAKAADLETQTAAVELAITEGRAHATMRDDLLTLATSDEESDRAMFGRLTASKIAGAPRGRIVSGEKRPKGVRRGTSNRKADIAGFDDAELFLYRSMIGAKFSHEDALAKVAEQS